jgi:beta-glucosidase
MKLFTKSFCVGSILLTAGVAVLLGNQNKAKYQDYTATPEARAADLVSQMRLEEKIGQMQYKAPAIPRLGIPAYDWWNEALHGVARAGYATVFPQAIELAATWDTDLESRIADAISTEGRAKYNDAIKHDNHDRFYGLTFWCRTSTSFVTRGGQGTGDLRRRSLSDLTHGDCFIKAMQGNDARYFKTIATSKHFAVHSGPETTRHQFNSKVDDLALDDTYLYAFQATVAEGGWTLSCVRTTA